MSGNSYWIDVRHDGLRAWRRISGRNPDLVRARASAQLTAWDEKWSRMQEKTDEPQSREEKKAYALHLTRMAAEALTAIENTLAHSLERSPVQDWEQLKDKSQFEKPKPAAPALPKYPSAPVRSDKKYDIQLSFWDKRSKARRDAKEAAAHDVFNRDYRLWEFAKERMDEEYEWAMGAYADKMKAWEAEKTAFLAGPQALNAEIEATRNGYPAKLPEAVADYCDLVLTASEYPDSFPKSWQLEYNPNTRLLLVQYSLPNIDALPKLKEVKYVVSRDEFAETNLSNAALGKIYDVLIHKIILRTLHELFEADVAGAIDAIVCNGWVHSEDKATGQAINACIASVQATKQQFAAIDLAQVTPKACFKKLKGLASKKPAALVPVRPLLQPETSDARFALSHLEADRPDGSVNLAAMEAEDFEQLILKMLEQEFNSGGSEVTITQATHDDGVDAIVFDPDPLRGGKIMIQVKRDTNPIAIDWVRDLYRTVIDEGANKGILMTTVDFDPDACEFAKNKPLTLVSGSGLLQLLEKHGRRARIDLREAKRALQDAAK
jgi:restriction system protein